MANTTIACVENFGDSENVENFVSIDQLDPQAIPQNIGSPKVISLDDINFGNQKLGSTASINWSIHNRTGQQTAWQITQMPSWIKLDKTGGTLAAHETTIVKVTLNPNNMKNKGAYTGWIKLHSDADDNTPVNANIV